MGAIHDISGFQIFSGSEIGHAHVVAHRMLDRGRFERGHEVLGGWLEGRQGEGSQWVHIQWHMMVFELALGDWDRAHARFLRHILPVARTTDEAVTDASSGLWRLALAAPGSAGLPWAALAWRARTRMRVEREPCAELHDLLALAGAGDETSIAGWIAERQSSPEPNHALIAFARAFGALAAGDFPLAASRLERALPELPTLGGSRAQNELFHALHRFASSGASNVHVA